MALKRKRQNEAEFDDISSIDQPSSSATIQGKVTSLSPMKKGKTCQYFDGQLTDETAKIRFVGFSTSVRQKILKFQEKDDPVTLSHCQIQQSRKTDILELKLNATTEVQKANKEFNIPDDVENGSLIQLSEIYDLTEYSRVTVEINVLKIDDPVEIANGKKKQDIIIADNTQSARLTLWEEDIGKLSESKSYHLSNLLIREFQGKRYLTTTKEETHIEEISEVECIPLEEFEESEMDPVVTVIAVENISAFQSCMKCKCRIIKLEDEEELGQCTKCDTVQFLSETKHLLAAKMTVKSTSEEIYDVRAFGSVLLNIAETTEDVLTAVTLMKAKPFTMQQRDGIIQSIKRKLPKPLF